MNAEAPPTGWNRAAAGFVCLFMFEGVLRKWVFPSAANQLFFVKDLGLAAMFLSAGRSRQSRFGWLTWSVLGLCAVLFVFGAAQTVALDSSPFSMLIGLHGYAFPYLVTLGMALALPDRNALRSCLRAFTVILTIQTPIVIVQSVSGSSAFINKVVPGADQLPLALGLVRATGFMTSTVGLTGVLSIAVGIGFWQLMAERPVLTRWQSLVLLGATTLSVAFAGSRTAFVNLGLVYVVVALSCLMVGRARQAFAVFGAIFVLAAIATLALTVSPRYRDALNNRVQTAAQQENSTLRIERYFTSWVAEAKQSTALGSGMGTASHAAIATGASTTSWIEDDLPRTVHELGVPLGIAFVVMRFATGLAVAGAAIRVLGRRDCSLIPLAAGLVQITVIGQMTQQGDLAGAGGLALGLFVVAAESALTAVEADPVPVRPIRNAVALPAR